MNQRPAPAGTRAFLGGVEARRSVAYQDSKGVWTIGVGHTGPEVVIGLTWTDAQIDAQLDKDIAVAIGRIYGAVHEAIILDLSDEEYEALISFVFNLGINPDWTIVKRLNADDLQDVPAEMLRFDKVKSPAGVVTTVPGLLNRRMAEVSLWQTGDHAASVAVVAATTLQPPPSSIIRESITPPTPLPPKPLAGPSLTAKVVSTVAAVGAGASQVSNIVQPHADAAPVLGKVVAGLAIVIVVCSVAGLFISQHQSHAAKV